MSVTPAIDVLATAVRDLGGTMCVAVEVDGHLLTRRSLRNRFTVSLLDPDDGVAIEQELAPAGTSKALLTAYHALRSYQHGNVATALAGSTADHLAALLGEDDGVLARLLPTVMTPAIEDVLGQLNFVVGPIAHAFQAAGEAIPKRCEAEQAHVLFRFLHLALQHGEDWRQEARKQLAAAIDAVKAEQAEESTP